MKGILFYRILFLIFLGLLNQACKWGNKIDKKYLLKYGTWRGSLITKGGEAPFLFDLKLENDSVQQLTLINGDEKIITKDLLIQGDSILIQFPVYESVIVARISAKGDSLIGEMHKTKYDEVTKIPFLGLAGTDNAFKFLGKNAGMPADFRGKWETTFLSEDGESSLGLGVLTQSGVDLTGSFLTPTGDYRYLTGIADGDSMFLSGFDGSGIYLFKAKKTAEGLSGLLYSGKNDVKKWNAKLNPNYVLPETNQFEVLKAGTDRIAFELPDINGKRVTLKDDRFKNKVVIVQLLGSWCPNCMDETAFLAPFYKQYKTKGVEIVGLSFERTSIPEKAKDNVLKLINRLDVSYPMLLAGSPKNENVSKILPEIKAIVGFPTTIIIDKKGKIRQVNTGFSGPGTGNYYTEYTQKFTSKIDQLLAE